MTGDKVRNETLSVEVLERIDSICVDFENALRCSDARLEDYLACIAASDRAHLFRELLAVELEWQFPNAFPEPNRYYKRFPDYRLLIDSVYEKIKMHRRGVAGILPRRFGHFELLELLGQGGMGLVYRANQLEGERVIRTVALKVIRPDRLGVALMRRFLTEREVTAQLEHRHIVRVYEVGRVDSQYFFSMELVSGQSLDTLLRQQPIGNRESAELTTKIADALDFVHTTRRVIHRDVKPRNILMNEDREPFLADFGLAKDLSSNQEMTEAGELLGTAPFMSPEQALRQKSISPASDIYSLGATLYAMLTGRPPFQAASVAETLHQVIHSEPVPPRQLNPGIARELNAICMKCLEKRTNDRFSSASALRAELDRYLDGKPLTIQRVSAFRSSWRWCKQNAAAASLMFAVVLFLSAISLVATFGYASTRAARDEIQASAYPSRIRAAKAFFDDGDVPQARQVLRECPPNLRGFEWDYMDGLCRGTVQLDIEQLNWATVSDLRFTRNDSQVVLIGGVADATPQVAWFDVETGEVQQVLSLPSGRPATFIGGLSAVLDTSASKIRAYSLLSGSQIWEQESSGPVVVSPDGKLIAACTLYGVALIDARSGEEVTTTSSWCIDGLRGPLSISHDNRFLAARSNDGWGIFSIPDGRIVSDVPTEHAFTGMQWSPKSKYLILYSTDEMGICNLQTGAFSPVTHNSAAIQDVAFSLDETHFAVALYNPSDVALLDLPPDVVVYSSETGTVLGQFRADLGSPIAASRFSGAHWPSYDVGTTRVAYDPQQGDLFTLHPDGSIRSWGFDRSLPLVQQLWHRKLSGLKNRPRSVAFDSAGNSIAVHCDSGVFVYTSMKGLGVVSHWNRRVSNIAYNGSHGSTVFTESDGGLIVHDLLTAQSTRVESESQINVTRTAADTPRSVIYFHDGTRVDVDLDSDVSYQVRTPRALVQDCAISPDGGVVATVHPGEIVVSKFGSGRTLLRLDVDAPRQTQFVGSKSLGYLLASPDRSVYFKVVDLLSGRTSLKVRLAADDSSNLPDTSMCTDASGRFVCVSNKEKDRIELWDLNRRTLDWTKPFGTPLAFSPDAAALAVANSTGDVLFIDRKDGATISHIRFSPSELRATYCWSPSGDRFATLTGDELTLWKWRRGESVLSINDTPYVLLGFDQSGSLWMLSPTESYPIQMISRNRD